MNKIFRVTHRTPAGEMMIASAGDHICMCDWTNNKKRTTIDRRMCRCLDAELIEGSTPAIEKAISELDEYFSGTRQQFTVPIKFGGSDFQRRVWAELMKIPYGLTISYADLATRIDNPKAVRAVASATATNPISIFVPCHRVIGSNRKLTGYGGGLEAKRFLLELESQGSRLF